MADSANGHFLPTDEQLAALDLASGGESFKIVAYAGAGKTSTLRLISEQKQGRGLYLAFNKAIASDAQGKFSGNVRCQTFHSLAFRHVHRDITAKISAPKQPAAAIAQALKLSPMSVNRNTGSGKKSVLLNQFMLGNMLDNSLSAFCKTSSQAPAARHIQLPAWIDDADARALRQQLFPALQMHWQQAIDPRHPAGISHDVYLKLWTLSRPIIPADFVLFDEAQDADPLMMGVLLQQDCQTIYVGDAHQQIYAWRGAVNAMKSLPLPETKLTQSFRFGKEIADVANVLLRALQESTPLRGHPTHSSSVQNKRPLPHKNAMLCRTNATAMRQLLQGLQAGHKVALQADSERMLRFCRGAQQLQNGQLAQGLPELVPFSNWAEVQSFSESHAGSELKTWVKLIEEYGTPTLSQAIKRLTHIKDADYIISTAHKAKGLEWQNVQIADDFLFDVNKISIKISSEELRLLYVACTRAKTVLDVHAINALLHGLEHKKVIYA